MAKKVKGGGSKLSRSETVSVRLDPKLRFAAELAARKHRRTLSSFIEWAVEEATQRVPLSIPDHQGETDYAYDAIEKVWDVDEADRFAKFALEFPFLLTHEEEVLWKLICENGYVWKGRFIDNEIRGVSEWRWKTKIESLIFKRLRENWEVFNSVAKGDSPESDLPGAELERPIEPLEDSDIPF